MMSAQHPRFRLFLFVVNVLLILVPLYLYSPKQPFVYVDLSTFSRDLLFGLLLVGALPALCALVFGTLGRQLLTQSRSWSSVLRLTCLLVLNTGLVSSMMDHEVWLLGYSVPLLAINFLVMGASFLVVYRSYVFPAQER